MDKRQLSSAAKIYIAVVCAVGAATLFAAAIDLYQRPVGWRWVLLAILTLLSGSATVRLPSVPATISISETFVFTAVLLFGPAAGTLTVALDALVLSVWLAWRGHPLYRLAFNVAALPASLWVAAHVYYLLGDVPPLYLSRDAVEITRLVIPLVAFTTVYFLLNSWLIAVAISLEKGEPLVRIWKDNFAWLSLNYFGGASVAALLITYTRNIDYAYLAFALPLLAIIYFTFSMSLGRVADADRHIKELNSLYLSTIETLAMAIDAKDQITHGHIRRVQAFAMRLAHEIGLTEDSQIRAIEAASLLHDMGKLAVPEYILNKPGPLTTAEFEKMKLHASVGADILSSIDFPYPVVPIVRHHHENWDGSGYPDALKGSEIPIGARILSVVDCFDALTSDRPYRPRLADAQAIRILLDRKGSMYDPLVVDAFVTLHSRLSSGLAVLPGVRGLESISTSGVVSGQTTGAGLDDIAASTEESLILYEITRELSVRSGLDELLPVLGRHIRRLVPVTTLVIYSFDSEKDELVPLAAEGEHASHFFGLRIPRGQRLSGWVAANRQTIVNSDPALDLGETSRNLSPRLRSCLSTTLIVDQKLVGVITLYSTKHLAFLEDHSRIVAVIAEHIAKLLAKSTSLVGGGRGAHYTAKYSNDAEEAFHRLRLLASPLTLIYVELETQVDTKTEHIAGVMVLIRKCAEEASRGSAHVFESGVGKALILVPHGDLERPSSLTRMIAHRLESSASQAIRSIRVRFGSATTSVDGQELSQLILSAQERALADSPSDRPPSIH